MVLLVDFDLRIKFIQQYPATTGRNFFEVLRAIDCIALTTFHRVGTPANWAQGEDVMVLPEITAAEAEVMFPKGFLEVRPWFRITPPPDMDEKDAEDLQNAIEDDEPGDA
mmetsp:Transcript_20221/g.61351  ORF Transcript_20221/g.61351 Transcript_20221/m.61351 type:complete len:110 (-) Transcript_20221:2157-2486(-)